MRDTSLTKIRQWRNRQWGSSHVATNLVGPNFDFPSRDSEQAGAIRQFHRPSGGAEYEFDATETDTRHHSAYWSEQMVAKLQCGVVIPRRIQLMLWLLAPPRQ